MYMFQNMLNNFDQSSPSLKVLSEALASMTGVAQHINEMKRHHERAVHVQEIQTLLYESRGADYTSFGSLVLEVIESRNASDLLEYIE